MTRVTNAPAAAAPLKFGDVAKQVAGADERKRSAGSNDGSAAPSFADLMANTANNESTSRKASQESVGANRKPSGELRRESQESAGSRKDSAGKPAQIDFASAARKTSADVERERKDSTASVGSDRKSSTDSATGGVAKITQQIRSMVLFFPDPALPCFEFLNGKECRRDHCKFSHEPTSLSRFIERIRGAKQTLDVCVFNITADSISNEIIAAHRRGVKVRVLTDDDQSNSQGSDVNRFRDAGIPVRMDNSPAHMHNKFCVIDRYIVMNGSFNWTLGAVTQNNENVVVTDDPNLAQAFTVQFEKLWNQFAKN